MDKQKIRDFLNKINIFLNDQIVPLIADIICLFCCIDISIKDGICSGIGFFIVINVIMIITVILYIMHYFVDFEHELPDIKDIIKPVCIYLAPYFIIIEIVVYYIWINGKGFDLWIR